MKNTLRKTLSLFLAFTLLCSLGLTAAASEAMGEDLTSKGTLLNQKTQLSTNVFWSTAYSDLRTENLITYYPNEAVTPVVTYGDTLTSRNTVSSAAKTLESQGYRVVAGINGDFFNTSNGLPIGILVSEGEVLSSDGGYYAMGFREDGSAVIGKPGLSISANLGYQGSDSSGYFTDIIRTVAGINKARVSTGGIYLYTYDFNNRHTTGNTEAGVDVLCIDSSEGFSEWQSRTIGWIREHYGDSVKIGDPIATVETAKTYASTDGTVSGVFAHEGDSADGVKTQYGALVYIEPINRFTLACSTEKGYNSSENRYIHIGETVFLKCTKDGSHQGRGVVTGLDEKDDGKFTVEVTGGEFYMGETVDIYRSGDYANASRIGRGTVGRTQTVAVNAEGSVLKMHVKAGDTVERGELLFETVRGTLDGLYAPEKQVVSDVAGVIATVDAGNGATVEKDAKIATIYPNNAMQIKMVISEADLMDVTVGGKAEIEFNWDADSGRRFEGTISSISYLSEKKDDSAASQSAQYVAYVDFTPDETVRIGMTVIVYVE